MVQYLSDEEVRGIIESGEPTPAGYVEEYYNDPDIGPPLRVFIALDMRTVGQHLSELDRYYNRVLWNSRFVKAFRDKFGFDAGVEQGNFQVVADTLLQPDWEIVEQIQISTLGPEG